jgi:hypothetical protein
VKNLCLLFIGVEPTLQDQLRQTLAPIKIVETPLNSEVIKNLDSNLSPVAILIRNPELNEEPHLKQVGTWVRELFPEIPMFAYFKSRDGYQKKLLSEPGFHDLFLLPVDLLVLKSELSKLVSVASSGDISYLFPVNIADILPDDPLPFETQVFLPANQKFVRVSKAGETYSFEKLKKIKEHHFNIIHVPYDQMGLFYAYMANRFKSTISLGMGITEKRDRLSKQVRSLMTDILEDIGSSEESGKRILLKAKETIKVLVKSEEMIDWNLKFEEWNGGLGDEYSHAVNVSTFAALISKVTATGHPEDLALAGLFHDLDLSLIQAKKIPLPETVINLIGQQRQLNQGKGFSNKESQLISIIHRMDLLINTDLGQLSRINLKKAYQMIQKEQEIAPASILYDRDLFEKIGKIIQSSE